MNSAVSSDPVQILPQVTALGSQLHQHDGEPFLVTIDAVSEDLENRRVVL